MKFPLNMVIKVNNQEELNILNDGYATLIAATESLDVSTKNVLSGLIASAELRKVDSHEESRVLINGQEIAIGTKEDMVYRFKTECDMHQGSNVTMQEWKNGKFEQVKARRIQKRK